MFAIKAPLEKLVSKKMKISIIKGDITKIKADAIVNPTNSLMLEGSGVDGAIKKAAGPKLQKECNIIRESRIPYGLKTGEAIYTNAYNLPAKIIIHTLGPKYYSQNIELLKSWVIR